MACGISTYLLTIRLQVVFSFVLASVMTTSASVLAMLLDQAFDSKGQFTLRAPIRYIREQFLDTEWKREYAWRPFLDPLIIGLGDQQLITGYAVLLSGWTKVLPSSTSSLLVNNKTKVGQKDFRVQGAHFVLILYICALSSSSHLAALLTLRKYLRKYKLIAKIRIALVFFFAACLLTSMITAICMPPTAVEHNDGTSERSRKQRLSFVVPLFLILVGFSTALVCILYDPKRKATTSRALKSSGGSTRGLARRVTDPRQRCLPLLDIKKTPAHIGLRILYYLFLNPIIAFAVQILLAMFSTVLVLSQKFAAPKDPERFCGLQDAAENVWGFGQTLSVVMLLLPAMSAFQTYLEGRQDIGEGFTRSKDRE
jgi:hypothetical protein